MRYFLLILVWMHAGACAFSTDFDVVVVGTSPISMLEAIYHAGCNERVLILEKEQRCGGAWKSISICGVEQADVGCHLVGSDYRLKEFFEKYFGCHFICLEHPYQAADQTHRNCKNGFYFSRGCFELISRLEEKISASSNVFLLRKELESIFIDQAKEYVELKVEGKRYTAKKMLLTTSSCFKIDYSPTPIPVTHQVYNHLYMLVEDSTLSRFTYLNGIIKGMSRAMNLTPFVDLPGPNLQLIAVQLHNKPNANDVEKFLRAFKDKQLLTSDARVVSFDFYAYEQCRVNGSFLHMLGDALVEVLDSSNFSGMVKHLERWKQVLKPLQ